MDASSRPHTHSRPPLQPRLAPPTADGPGTCPKALQVGLQVCLHLGLFGGRDTGQAQPIAGPLGKIEDTHHCMEDRAQSTYEVRIEVRIEVRSASLLSQKRQQPAQMSFFSACRRLRVRVPRAVDGRAAVYLSTASSRHTQDLPRLHGRELPASWTATGPGRWTPLTEAGPTICLLYR